MVKTIDRETAMALDNMVILLQARERGLEIRPEDIHVNYAEIDFELTAREDKMVQQTKDRILERVKEWLSKIADPADVDPKDLGLDEIFADELLQHTKSTWIYGGQTADDEMDLLGLSSNTEDYVEQDWSNLTNDDAFEWYDRYAKKLGENADAALFVQMQPLILEAIENGTLRTELSNTLAQDFARYGSVRADIIARTESNKAFNWGRRFRFDQSASLGGYRYSAIMDGRTTQMCQRLHGVSWVANDAELDVYTPPNHYRCRSLLVPISIYTEDPYDGTESGWEDSLPASEKKVLDKFKDPTWYPMAKNIRSKDVPDLRYPKPNIKKKAPAAKKKPPAPPAPAADQTPEEYLKAIKKRTDLTDEDKTALANAMQMIGPEDISDKMKFAKGILARAGLMDQGLKVSHRKIKALGHVQYVYYKDRVLRIKEFAIMGDKYDARGHAQKIKTVLHEFYHANYHGLKTDRIGGGVMAQRLLEMEETATELAAHYMARKMKNVQEVLSPSYAEYLFHNVPKLKQMDDFAAARTLDDFGEKFMKYRFSEKSRTAEWTPMVQELKKIDIPDGYYDKYEEYVLANKESMVERVFSSLHQTNKSSSPAREKQIKDWISGKIDNGLRDRNRADFAYYQSMMNAMNDLGVD